MTRVMLRSSMMVSTGYDSATRVLEIEFATGAVYHYFDVPLDVYQDLLDAPSQGQVFHNRIRGIFECHRVTYEISAQ
jgi:KTSC domain